MGKPEKITINHDDYHAKHIGLTADGFQFFLATPFEPAIGDCVGCEYIALFKFNIDGDLVDYQIENLGPRHSLDSDKASAKYNEMYKSLGDVKHCRIEVKPFVIQTLNVDMGLIIREPEDEEDVYAVELLPGNYMAFFEPWDSGEYDT